MIDIVIINYPTASQAAVYGFYETMMLANKISEQLDVPIQFDLNIDSLEELDSGKSSKVVVLPPCVSDEFYTQNNSEINQYLSKMHQQEAILASACVGAFILARGGFLDNKFCTTHWRLAESFRSAFPRAKLNANAIIVNEGSVITAGGLMAWLDLAFEIISLFSSPTVVQQLSKEMVVDNGFREQRFYQQFVPKLNHGDELVLNVQSYLNDNFSASISLTGISESLYVSPRTLQRRFVKVTGLSIVQYLQKLRLHNACQLLELTKKGISEVCYQVGYQDTSAFRKIFIREYGLSPAAYRKRFSDYG